MALYLTAMVKKKSFLNHAMQLKLNTLVHCLSFCELSVQDITYASAVDVSLVLVYCYHPFPTVQALHYISGHAMVVSTSIGAG